jgi:AmmeMemoRadiSam system protein B
MLTSAAQFARKSDSPAFIRAMIVPHAGYSYCLNTSIHAFVSLDPSQYDRVFVLGPSHSPVFHHCAIPDAESADTPLGPIPIDVDCAR